MLKSPLISVLNKKKSGWFPDNPSLTDHTVDLFDRQSALSASSIIDLFLGKGFVQANPADTAMVPTAITSTAKECTAQE